MNDEHPAPVIGVIGAASGSPKNNEDAFQIGSLIARKGWTLVTGGLSGVMHYASRGASSEGGIIVGILPHADRTGMSPYVTIPIVTNMGHARNVIIAHTADALIAVGGEYGTVSEMSIGLKLGKPVVAIDPPAKLKGLISAESPEEAIGIVMSRLKKT
ncbi:TIGR00725 family protein [Acidobacteriota bacterium]